MNPVKSIQMFPGVPFSLIFTGPTTRGYAAVVFYKKFG
jgi:hypothetical protein